MSDAEFATQLERYTNGRLRGQRLRVILLAILVVAAIAYLGWLHSQLRHVEAPALVDIGKAQLQERLPDLRDELAERLAASAPEVLQLAQERLLAAPGHLRNELQEPARAALNQRLEGLRLQAGDALDHAIDRAAEQIAKAGPDQLAEERVWTIIEAAVTTYEEEIGKVLGSVAVEHQAEIDALHDYFGDLAEPERLSRKQRLERQLVQATLALVDKLQE